MRAIYKFARLSPRLALAIALTFSSSVTTFGQDATAIVGNHPRTAETEVTAGLRASAAPLTMAVSMRMRNRAGAEQLLAQLQDPTSPHYHHWLTSTQFATRFNPVQADVDAVTNWLTSEGFTVVSSSPGQRLIRFSGTVAQAQQTFRTTIYNYGNGDVYGNVEDPVIPVRFAGVIAQVHGLNNMFAATPTSRFIPHFAKTRTSLQTVASHPKDRFAPKVYAALGRDDATNDAAPAGPSPDAKIGNSLSFGPADFLTFYNESPLALAGNNGGSGDCIAIIGDSDFESSAVTKFNTNFGQAASTITTVVVNGFDPGFNNDEEEALLDLEWSHAVAPGAATRYYVGNSAKPVIAPIVDEVNAAVNDNLCGVISVSFSLCGGSGSFFTNTVSPIDLKAALQGQSIFVSSGDNGAAGQTYSSTLGCIAGTTPNVNELSTDPNVTSVGGASFNPVYDGSNANTSLVTSTALRVWNDPNDGKPTGGASGGGASAYYAKPSYQTGLGVPADSKRDVPDISLIASPYFPGAFTYMDGNCFVTSCDGKGTPTAAQFGGTSLAAPAWAGIAKLVAQQNSTTRLGSINAGLYQLANSVNATTVFQDITSGNNNFGVVTGYTAGAGFDLATGWGNVDIDALAVHFPVPTATPTATATATATATDAATPTATATPTAIASPTATATPAPTATPTPLPGPSLLTFSPKTLAYGNVDFAAAGSASRVKKLTIINPKKYAATAIISAIVASPGFTVDPACNNVTLAPGQKLVCAITYTPTTLGAVAGTLTVTDNAGGSPQTVAVNGAGIQGRLIATPGTLNFGKVPLNTTSAARAVTLKNKTGSTFTISRITNSNPAFVTSQSCIGHLGATACSVSVTYTPAITSKVTDTMTITDLPDGITRVVNLIGTGL